MDGVSNPAAILSGTYTFNNVTANHTISASFAPAGPFTIIATSGSNGSVTPPGTTTLPCGASQTYIITPNPGFVRSTVLIDGVNNPGAVTSGTYTFSNVTMNHTIHATFVTACSPTTVTITTNSINDFCANLTLTANPATPGPYTYEWKRGATVVGNSQTLALTTAFPDGVYTVTAASGPTCVSAPASFTYMKQVVLQSYTILGLDKVDLGESNTVLKGSVGNTKPGGEIKIKKNGWVASPGAFVKASKITVDNPSNVPIRIFAPVTVPLPTMMYNTTSTSGLSNLSIPKTAVPSTYTGNYNDVTVKKGAITTLTGTIFGKVKLEEGAQVTFTRPVINMKELELQDGKSDKLTQVKFTGNCKVLVKKKVRVGEYCRVNTSSPKNVIFFLEDENFEVKSNNTNVTASVYAPTNDIRIDGDGPCFMTGRFIAKHIDGDAKNVTWNNYDCANPPPAQQVVPVDNEIQAITKIEAMAYPNPSANWFNVKLNTDGTDQVTIRVISVTGQVMQELKGSPDQTFRVGDRLLPGIYLAELRQGKETVTVKLLKQ